MAIANDLYPSRIGEEETLFERKDPVVYGKARPESENSLSLDQLDAFEREGFLVLPDYMPEMVEPLLDEIERLKEKMAGKEELFTEPDNQEIRTIFKPFAYSDLVDRFTRHPRILGIAEQLLGSEVYVTQSRINVKPAYRGKSFPWHSDFETWHVEDGMPRMRAVTAWIMLTENVDYNGPLYVIPGSHKKFVSCAGTTEEENYNRSLKQQTAGVPTPESMQKLLDENGIRGIYGEPGTVVFHECNLMHGSPDNISGTPRTLLMVVYNSCENRMVEPYCGLPPRPHYLRNPDPTPLRGI